MHSDDVNVDFSRPFCIVAELQDVIIPMCTKLDIILLTKEFKPGTVSHARAVFVPIFVPIRGYVEYL